MTSRPFGARHSHTLVEENDVIYLIGGAPEVDEEDDDDELAVGGYQPLADVWISYDGGATWREERLQEPKQPGWKAYECQTSAHSRHVFFRNLATDVTQWEPPSATATAMLAAQAGSARGDRTARFPKPPPYHEAMVPQPPIGAKDLMAPRFAHASVLDPVRRELFVLAGHGAAARLHRRREAHAGARAAQQRAAAEEEGALLAEAAGVAVHGDAWKLVIGAGEPSWRPCPARQGAGGHGVPPPRYGASATLIRGRKAKAGRAGTMAGGGYMGAGRRVGGGGGGGGGRNGGDDGMPSTVVLIGGRGVDGKALGDIWTAQTDGSGSLEWEKLWPKPEAESRAAASKEGGIWPKQRAHHTALVVKQAGGSGGGGGGDGSQYQLYVMGGQGKGAGMANEHGLLSDVWCSRDGGRSWKQATADAQFGERCGHASVAGANGELYVIGGLRVSEDASGAEARFDESGAVVGEMDLADEAAISDPQSDVWCSSDGGKSWECRCENAPWVARFGHAAVCVRDANGNDAICIVGGQGLEDVDDVEPGTEGSVRWKALGDVWRSDDGGRTWRPPAPYAANTALVLGDGGTYLFNTEHETHTRLGGAGSYAAPGVAHGGGWNGLRTALYTPKSVLAFAPTGLYALSPNLEASAGAAALVGSAVAGDGGGATAVATEAAKGMGSLANASWKLLSPRSERSPWHRAVAAVHVGYGRAVVLTETGASLLTPSPTFEQHDLLSNDAHFAQCKAAVYVGKNKVLAFTANWGILEVNVTRDWDPRRSRVRQLGAAPNAEQIVPSLEWAAVRCAVYLRGNGTPELPGNQVLAVVANVDNPGIRLVDTITGAVFAADGAAVATSRAAGAAPPAPPPTSSGGSVVGRIANSVGQAAAAAARSIGGDGHQTRGDGRQDLVSDKNKHWRAATVAMVHEASGEVLVFCGKEGTYRCRHGLSRYEQALVAGGGRHLHSAAEWQAVPCKADLQAGTVRGAIPLVGSVPQVEVPLPTRTVAVEKDFGTRAFHAAVGMRPPKTAAAAGAGGGAGGPVADQSEGTLVLAGGIVDGEARSDVWVSRSAGRHWELVNAAPGWEPRCQHTLVVRKIATQHLNADVNSSTHGRRMSRGSNMHDYAGGGAAAVEYDDFGNPITRSPVAAHSRNASRLPGGRTHNRRTSIDGVTTPVQSETTELILIGGIAGLDATTVRAPPSVIAVFPALYSALLCVAPTDGWSSPLPFLLRIPSFIAAAATAAAAVAMAA